MSISAAEIGQIIKRKIADFDAPVVSAESGVITTLGDGIAQIYGLEGAMAGELYEAEAYARNRQIGLWKLPTYRVLLPAETLRAYGFQIVEGRVRRLSPDGGALEFGDDPGAGFRATVDPKARDELKSAGKAPEQLRGHLVRVRGWLRDGDGGPRRSASRRARRSPRRRAPSPTARPWPARR